MDAKHYTVISFSPQNKATSVLDVSGPSPLPKPEKLLGIPVDGTVSLRSSLDLGPTTSKKIGNLFSHLGQLDTNLTSIDLFRLSLAAKAQGGKNEAHETLTMPQDQAAIDTLSTELFHENVFETENMTIQINNGTGVSGLGKRLERVIANIGGNVVAVSNTDQEETTSSIVYYQKKNETVKRLEKILGYPSHMTETKGISDIIITIGQDRVDNFPY